MSNSPSASGISAHPYVQKEISGDWNNREFIQVISANIKKISDSLNAFDFTCRSRLAELHEQLQSLQNRVEYLEAKASKSEGSE
jgi:uncharacterized protein